MPEPTAIDTHAEIGSTLLPATYAAALPDHGEGIEAISTLAKAANALTIINLPVSELGDGLPSAVPVLVDHANRKVSPLRDQIEAYRTGPDRRRGKAIVTTLGSFVDLVNRHKNDGSVIFAETKWPKPTLTAVIDYHDAANAARLCEHRIIYPFPVTPELVAWIEGNGKPMEQVEFARFLEDHAAELAAPLDGEKSEYERLFKERFATPNELLDLSRYLEVFVSHKVKNGARLQTGERTIEFTEEHTNAKGQPVEIPGIFMVSVPAFLDGAAVRIPARLRYRIAGGGIKWHYQLYRWDFELRVQVQNDMVDAAKRTALPAFEGTPEIAG